MHLTHYTNYALRVLMYLALRQQPVRIAEIAERHNISRHHLVKIVHQLGQSGYVLTTRGRGGGIQLACPPATISVGEIVRLTEDHMMLVECFGEVDAPCKIKSVCRLRKTFARALAAFMQELDRVSIADIAANRTQLHHALGLGSGLMK